MSLSSEIGEAKSPLIYIALLIALIFFIAKGMEGMFTWIFIIVGIIALFVFLFTT